MLSAERADRASRDTMSSLVAQRWVDSNVALVAGLLVFVAAGTALVLGVLLLNRLMRSRVPHPEKGATYECGERTIGAGWVQFDLRFYVVALVFVIFDVEIALLYPWAVVFGAQDAQRANDLGLLDQIRTAALWDMLFFLGVIVVGFLYLWRYGYLDWVRATGRPLERSPEPPGAGTSALEDAQVATGEPDR